MTNWNAAPQTARWYGEVIFEGTDGNTDYNYGYSDAEYEPESDEISELAPEGALIIETTAHMNQAHPDYDPQQGEE
jgi:hypothetical protein